MDDRKSVRLSDKAQPHETEARLARALTLGESLEVYARVNDVRLSTVKTQLRSIVAKTGTDRQSAIVRLIIGIRRYGNQVEYTRHC